MSKLDELGGLEAAKKFAENLCSWIGDNPHHWRARGQLFVALIEHVEELEREVKTNEARIESMYIQWNRADSQLQAALELAEMVKQHGDKWGWFHGMSDELLDGQLMDAKAREFLKMVEGKHAA